MKENVIKAKVLEYRSHKVHIMKASPFPRVSGIPLTGLHLRQALDILRTSPPVTLLQVAAALGSPMAFTNNVNEI